MRIIEYPLPAEEQEVKCRKCSCLLAYTKFDTYRVPGVAGDRIRVKCPCCGTELQVDYIPYPHPSKNMAFDY